MYKLFEKATNFVSKNNIHYGNGKKIFFCLKIIPLRLIFIGSTFKMYWKTKITCIRIYSQFTPSLIHCFFSSSFLIIFDIPFYEAIIVVWYFFVVVILDPLGMDIELRLEIKNKTINISLPYYIAFYTFYMVGIKRNGMTEDIHIHFSI